MCMCYSCYFGFNHYGISKRLQREIVFGLEPEIKHNNSFVNNELIIVSHYFIFGYHI